MNKALSIILYLLIIFSLPVNNFSQEFIVSEYTSREGLPTNIIYDIFQADDLKIWAATEDGIYVYDASDWRIQTSDSINLNISFLRLEKDERNKIWVLPKNSQETIPYYSDGKWKSIAGHGHSDFNKNFCINYSNDLLKILLITDDNKLLIYENDKWKKIEVQSEFKNIDILSCTAYYGEFLISTRKGVLIVKENSLVPFAEINKLLPTLDIQYIRADKINESDEMLWLLSETWIGHYIKGEFNLISDKLNLPVIKQGNIYSFLSSDGEGTIFFGNHVGLYSAERKSGKVQEVLYDQEAEIRGGTSLLIDHEKNIWISTLRGLVKLRRTPFVTYNKKNGLPMDEVASIEALSDGRIIFGQNGSLSILDDDKIETIMFSGRSGRTNLAARVMDIIEGSDGSIFFVAHRLGLGKLVGEKAVWLYRSEEINMSSIEFDKNGNLWVTTDIGLYRYENGKFIFNETFGKRFIRKIKIGKGGELLLCTPGAGFFILKDDQLINYSSSNTAAESCYNVYYDSSLGYLVGTDDGLYSVDGDSLRKFKHDNFEVNSSVYFIEKGNDEVIWIGTEDGVIKWNREAAQYYNVNNGLSGNETNRSAASLDINGNFWIGTETGGSMYNKKYDYRDIARPIIKIIYTEKSSGEKNNDLKNLKFLSDDNVTVHFRGISYIDEDKNQYLVKLLNEDDELVDEYITRREYAKFVSLSPGRYTSEITIISPINISSEIPAVITFEIITPIYFRWWFLALAALIGLLGIYLILGFFYNRRYTSKLERDVEARTRELKDSKEGLQLLAESTYEGIAFSDGKILTNVNQQLCNILDYEKNEIVGRNLFEFFLEEEHPFLIEKYLSKTTEPYEHKAIRKDGTLILLEARYKYLKVGNGELVIAAIRDITERKAYEQELIKAREEAEQSEKLKTEFLAQMSHEIRSPLNTILNFSELLESELAENESESYSVAFNSMNNAGKRIIRTIDLLLNMSELQTGTYKVKKRELKLIEEVINPIIDEYKPSANSKSISLGLKNNLESEEKIIEADHYTLSQIFGNLVDNALKFTHEGGIEIILNNSKNNNLVVEVKDTGIGVSKEYMPKIFAPFSQEEQGYTRKFEGSGLGLALVKNYCELNNIEISVESEKFEGTKFTLSFS
jgi:PAS domain S-box-containing protein